MLFDWLSDLASDLLSDAITDRTGDGRAGRRLTAFAEGKVIRVPCRFRAPTRRRWQRGTLRLSPGRAAWTRRWRRAPLLSLNRHETVPIDAAARGRSVVLRYDKGEFRVRRRDLAIIGRVLDLPPFAN